MKNACEDTLHSVLFEGDRELENFKFFPGDQRGLQATELCEAAGRVVRQCFEEGLIDRPPVTGKEKTAL